MLYLQTIDTKTLELLTRLMQITEFEKLNLVGGTSLALQIGHRKSIDLDLFGRVKFDDYKFKSILSQFDSVQLLNQTSHIKTYLINKTKVDFVNYPFHWLETFTIEKKIRLATKTDIAAMKLAAITGRGTKKDFIDIFFLLEYYSLEEIIRFYHQKFPDGSEFMVLKSLVYFEDAEKEPLPVMLKKTNWNVVKSKIVFETKSFIKSR
ncbi:MAG: nucleotidyl transferase AbiEii/AbiGii toxin family protein [Mariniphaga sp.]|nr:nucleotidyl transferase AbiEii/AbiGii toxin family protein [Mariniphaga sp.]